MKSKIKALVILATVMCITALLHITAGAAKYGVLTYEVSNGEITITDCNASASGTLELPASIEGYPVTKIEDSAFGGCTEITSFTVESGSEYFTAYQGVIYNKERTTLVRVPPSLMTFTVPNGITAIGAGAFYYCSSLTSVTIPDSVTSIGNSAFLECGALTRVTIPDGVTSIGDRAFCHCISLTSVTIPDSVTSIGDRAFCGCEKLAVIIVDENNLYYSSLNGNLFNKNKTVLLQYANGKVKSHYTIPNSVTSIGNYAFSYYNSLTSVTIPDSVTSIGNSAFYWSGLTGITIPDSVTSIGDRAFCYSPSLTSITIPDSVTSIGESVFSSCAYLRTISAPIHLQSSEASWLGDCTATVTYRESAPYYTVEITNAVTGNDSLKFITKMETNQDVPMINYFGTTFIPLWLYEDETAEAVEVQYDNWDYDIRDGMTFGATLTDIPESCKDMDIVAKSYLILSDGSEVWSAPMYANITNGILHSVESN